MFIGRRIRSKWWCTLLLLVTLTISFVQPAVAATPDASTQAIELLRQFNVVRGDQNGDLMLGAPITRAQMAVILIRLTGHESEVASLKSLGLFPDTNGHWAEGYIAGARMFGLMKGFDDGKFHPNDYVTYAQAFTLILRLVGREPAAQTWPTSALLDAATLQIVPPGFTGVTMLDQAAVRGEIFTSVSWALTKVKAPEGLSYLQKYLDSTAPVLTLESSNTTADAVYTLRGTAKDATRVTVNGEEASLAGGAFSKTVSLSYGANRFTVEAFDLAQNRAVQEFVVTRFTPASRITITGPSKVKIGGTATYDVTAYDANDNEVSAAGATVEVSGNIGTFDATTNTFHAGTSTASGKITVTQGTATASMAVQVLGPAASATALVIAPATAAYTQPMTVRVEVRDASGNLVTDDYGRFISLSAPNVTITPAQATTDAGVAQFSVRASKAGPVTFTATAAGLASASLVNRFTTTTRVVLVSDLTKVATSSSKMATIHAELRDATDNKIANTSGSDIFIDLALSGPGSLVSSRLRIAPNASTSTQTQNDTSYIPAAAGGTATVTGTISSGQDYSVESVSIQSYVPTIENGAHFIVVPLTSARTVPGSATFVVQLVDSLGNLIPSGNYGFQVAVTTSNKEPKSAGVPDGMSVQVGDNAGLNPVSDGTTGGGDIIARTVNGSAIIEVSYDKPGYVTITPVAVAATDTAYGNDGAAGAASASNSAWITTTSSATAYFTTTPTHLKATVDSDTLGLEQPAAGNKTGATRTIKVHAYLSVSVNDQLYWVPNTPPIRLYLYKNGDYATPVANTTTSDGKAEFTVSASTTAGEDFYEVKDSASVLIKSNPVYVKTETAVPAAPARPIMRGVPSNTVNGVLVTDTAMEVELPTNPDLHYVVAKLYVLTTDGASVVYTSGAVDVSSGAPKITVPRSVLPTGVKSFQLTYKNGAGESARGATSDPVTVYSYTTGVGISSARFNAVTSTLYLFGTGFASTDTVDPSKLTITDPAYLGADGSASLSNATVTYVSNSGGDPYFSLNLAGIPADDLTKIATRFAGSGVKISAAAGWLSKTSGSMANADLNNPMSPMARLNYAIYDKINHRLTISGKGFSTGTLVKSAIRINKATDPDIALDASGITVTTNGDTELVVSLSQAAWTALDTDATITIDAADGWLVSGSGVNMGKAAATSISVYAKVTLTSVQYNSTTGVITLTGSGFYNGRIPDTFAVRVWDASQGGNGLTLVAPATVVDDHTITFKLKDTDMSTFATRYLGGDVYLVADPDWLEIPVGDGYRPVYGIPSRILKFDR